jgi:hypothetical protein
MCAACLLAHPHVTWKFRGFAAFLHNRAGTLLAIPWSLQRKEANMAKRFLIVLAALAVTAAAVFAGGQNEPAAGSAFQGDKLVLKGTVSFQGLPQPILKSGDKQYLLMVPPYLVYKSGVKEGTLVSVQGWQLTDLPRWAGDDKSLVAVFVTQATVGGKDYDLTRFYAERMIGRAARGAGPRGMMRGYGPGYGYGMMGGGNGQGYGYGPGMMGPWGDGDDQ